MSQYHERPMIEEYPRMRDRLNTYTAYSIGCAIVWIVLIAIRLARGSTSSQHTLRFFMLGWAIGWTSATIARYVYLPPKKYRNTAN
jgi:hypothetical protein